MSVVFDFSASLNEVAPLSPILLSVGVIKMKKSDLLMHILLKTNLLCQQPSLSLVSTILDFNNLLNDDAPLSPILLTVDMERTEKVNCQWMPLVYSFFLSSQNR